MQDLELYRLTPLFWFDDSLSKRKNLIIEYKVDKRSLKSRPNENDGYSANRPHPRSRRLGSRPPVPYLLPYANDSKRSRTNGYANKAAC